MFGMGTGGTLAVNSPAKLSTWAIEPIVEDCIDWGTADVLDNYRACSQKSFSRAALCAVQSKFYGQAERAISTGKLHTSLRFHLQPINQVVFLGPSFPLRVGRSHLRACFPLICIQRLS